MSESTICRASARQRYTTIDNAVIEDRRLTLAARGLLIYLLSRPHDWCVNVKHLTTISDAGKHAIYSALKNLEAVGYVTKTITREGNRITGTRWMVYETPQHPENQDTQPERAENQDTGLEHPDFLDPGFLDTENPPLLITEEELTTDCTNPPCKSPPGDVPAVQRIVDAFNGLDGRRRRATHPDGTLTAGGKAILAQLKHGYTEDECLAVVRDRHADWHGDVKMAQYLTLETVFRASNFPKYLDMALSGATEAAREREALSNLSPTDRAHYDYWRAVAKQEQEPEDWTGVERVG